MTTLADKISNATNEVQVLPDFKPKQCAPVLSVGGIVRQGISDTGDYCVDTGVAAKLDFMVWPRLFREHMQFGQSIKVTRGICAIQKNPVTNIGHFSDFVFPITNSAGIDFSAGTNLKLFPGSLGVSSLVSLQAYIDPKKIPHMRVKIGPYVEWRQNGFDQFYLFDNSDVPTWVSGLAIDVAYRTRPPKPFP
ncbi:hypothetical protein K1X76_06685 [bacterium]|nr:hypothetical protein [bacterium]